MEVKPVPTLGWTRGSVAATILLVTQDQRDQIAMRVRALMQEQGFTNASLAYNAGVAEKTVSRLINGKKDSRYNTIDKVARVFGLEEQELRGPQSAPLALDSGPSQLDRIEQTLNELVERLVGAGVIAAAEKDTETAPPQGPAKRRRKAA
jgi:transcriptional regulator with XRE-family HTH domain